MDIAAAVRRLSDAVRFETVSRSNPDETAWDVFAAFADYLRQAFPLFHDTTESTRVGGYGLVYRWPGRSDALPVLLTAHYDVVAADGDGWSVPPFVGHTDGRRMHGRGTLDDKGSVIALLTAATTLMEASFQPARDVYIAFGCDEEQGGRLGAQRIAGHFRAQQIRFAVVLDEGGAVADGSMMGIGRPVAVIGVAEKGNNSFRLTFHGEEGHASTPPAHTAVGNMAAFIHACETRPLPPRLTPAVKAMLAAVAPYRPGPARVIMRHSAAFFWLLRRRLAGNRQTAAMLRTTVAFTETAAGSGHNVLPRTAACTANVRILPGDSVSGVLAWFRTLDPAVQIEPILTNEPTGSQTADSAAFGYLAACIKAVFPDAVPVPYLMVGGTDCRHYEPLAEHAYRFLPCRVSEAELAAMHGRNESISHENLAGMIRFYTHFIENLPKEARDGF